MKGLCFGVLNVFVPIQLFAQAPVVGTREVAVVIDRKQSREIPCPMLPGTMTITQSTDERVTVRYSLSESGRKVGLMFWDSGAISITDDKGVLIAQAEDTDVASSERTTLVRDCHGDILGSISEIMTPELSNADKTRTFVLRNPIKAVAAGFVKDHGFQLRSEGTGRSQLDEPTLSIVNIKTGEMTYFDGPKAVLVMKKGDKLLYSNPSSELNDAVALAAVALNEQTLNLIDQLKPIFSNPRRGPQGIDRGR
ncbi:MAG: hypothetical protein HY921_11610 [Elusimicrobia bacterium]|nr:hypothetical protein [Elusimicrobiota bacterium]